MTKEKITHSNQQTKNPKESMQQATLKRLKSLSPFWLLPFIALIIGIILFIKIAEARGETITIYFDNAAGITANKTPIRYQGLQIGTVRKVSFSEDLNRIIVTANINNEARNVLRENTKFWVVKPNASFAGISGLDALVSGNYITLSPGDGELSKVFTASTEGPIAQLETGDLMIQLVTDNLASINIGTPIFYRNMNVGIVANYHFNEHIEKIEIDAIIHKPYAHLVKSNSKFWRHTGISIEASLSGVNFNMNNLSDLIVGGISFDSPQDSPQAVMLYSYPLYDDEQVAQKNHEIKVTLPNTTGLIENKTLVYYQDAPIGMLHTINQQEDTIAGSLLIKEGYKHLFTDKSTVVLQQNNFSLQQLSTPNLMFQGPYFDIKYVPSDKLQSEFIVKSWQNYLAEQPDILLINLSSNKSYNIQTGEGIFYNDIKIGEVLTRDFSKDGFIFNIAIYSQYKDLVNEQSHFVAASNINVNLDLSGIEFNANPPSQWLQGGIQLITDPKLSSKHLEKYTLYPDISSATSGIIDEKSNTTLTLSSKQLPSGVNNGSVVLYKNYPVGQVTKVIPTDKGFNIDLFIHPKYRTFITKKSRFWAESATQVNISRQGIDIQSAPMLRVLKGAISFDNIGNDRTNLNLFDSERLARTHLYTLTIISPSAKNLNVGMPIQYLGLTVGEIATINIDSKTNSVHSTLYIDSGYYALLSKKGTQFKLIIPTISAGSLSNLDSLLQPYIEVVPGNGQSTKTFQLKYINDDNKELKKGVSFILETSHALNLSTDSVVQYRGVDVGAVERIYLSNSGERVLVQIIIAEQYKHLVRNNSQFWINSGYSFNFGLQGVQFDTGSVQQFFKGGIMFGTPSGEVVQPIAQPNQRFRLQQKAPDDAKLWTQSAY